MKSALRGKSTSAVEVTNVSSHGVWLWLGDREVFLPYERFPWFKDAPIGQVLNVERPSVDHLYWPVLDIDLHIESIDEPDRYPLISRTSAKKHADQNRSARARRPSRVRSTD
jgi:hypothetical protein